MEGSLHIDGRGTGTRRLRICIVSRKPLDRVTRIVRMARTLVDAGHSVTVISLRRPVDELVETVPDVEFHEVSVTPWTRQAASNARKALNLAAGSGKAQGGGGGRKGAGRSQWLAGSLRRLRVAALNLAHRYLLAPVTGVLLKRPSETLAERITKSRESPPGDVFQAYVQAFAQMAVTGGFKTECVAALGDRQFDYVQAHDNYALEPARALAKATGAQLVYDAVEISEHRLARDISRFELILERIQRRRERAIMKRARFMITVGDGLADWYAREYRLPRPAVIRNCRPFWRFERRDDIRRDCGVSATTPLVTWFGYAYPDQGLPQIIRAAARTPGDVHFALLADALPRWKNFLATELPEMAEAEGVRDRIHFLPAREPNDLISYVSGADIGIIPRPNVSPNVYYSMPNKFMEMVMARLPIVVSDLIDMRTLIERFDIGAICDVEDPQDVAGTIAAELDPDRHARLRENIEQAARTLTWETEGARYLGCYEAAEAGHPRKVIQAMAERTSAGSAPAAHADDGRG